MNRGQISERVISDLAGVFTDPIIVFPSGGWEDTIPDWLKQAITMERLVMNMKALKGEEMTGTDAEACAYLMPASLAQPLDHDWAEIYLYVSTQTCRKWRQIEVPGDIAVDSLRDDRMAELKRLKDCGYTASAPRYGLSVNVLKGESKKWKRKSERRQNSRIV